MILQLDIDLFLCNMTIKIDKNRALVSWCMGASNSERRAPGVLTEPTHRSNEWCEKILKKKDLFRYNGFQFSPENKKKRDINYPS